jgi:hypothetical protein
VDTNTLYSPNLILNSKLLISSFLYSSLTSGTNIVSIAPTSGFTGIYFDYYVYDGTNMRMGTVMAVWVGATVTYTDYSTADIGDTAGIEFTVTLSSPNIRLNAVITTGTWTVKTGIRII